VKKWGKKGVDKDKRREKNAEKLRSRIKGTLGNSARAMLS
jgi:hypothetical protein